MKDLRRFVLIIGAFVATSGPVLSQAQTPFTLVLTQDQQTSTLADGATLALSASAIGQTATATVAATYRGSSQVNVTAVELTGSSDFSLTATPNPSAVLRPGETVTISVRYRPSAAARVAGRIVLAFDEGGRTGSFSLNLAGQVPDFVFSYIQLPSGNAAPLNPGDTLRFPDTAARTSSTIAVTITNRGSGSGIVNSVTARGAAFALSGLPLLPATLEAGRELRINLVFTPPANGDATGGLTINVSGRAVDFTLAGKGTGPDYTYEALLSDGTRPLTPDGDIALPDVPVGQHSRLTIRVRNRGNAEGKISILTSAGAGFTLADVPFLPVSVAAGGSFAFTVDFDATQPGRFTGRLRIGDDTFQLTVLSLGSALQISYDNGSGAVTVANNGNIFFPPVAVGSTGTVRVNVRNTGTTQAQISIVAVSGTGFSVSQVPDLPLALKPDETTTIVLSGIPTSVSLVTGALRIDQLTFNLSLSGQAPPPLPAYRFTSENGSTDPMAQVAVGLSLASPYRLPIKGVLTLSFTSDSFTADPAVQFASGGKTIPFEIPADTTTAVFPGNANQARFQTGTVAGAINVTPTFFYETTNLTPTSPPPLVLQLAQGAPRIVSAQVASKNASGITLVVNGYATSRSVQQIDFEFLPLTNLSLPPIRFTLNSDSAFGNWYQSAQSQQFGSLFTVTVPFSGTVSNGGSLADVLETVRIRVSNQLGASTLYELSLR